MTQQLNESFPADADRPLSPSTGLDGPADAAAHNAPRSQPVEEAGFESLSPHYTVFEKRTNLIAAAVVLSIAAFILFPVVWVAAGQLWTLGLVAIAWASLAAVLIWAGQAWPPLAYRHTRWRINEEGMEIRQGVFWRHRTSVPAARVQHVDVSQGPVARIFEIGKLTIHTAGTKNASVELDGLPHARALEVRDQLIRQKESLDVL